MLAIMKRLTNSIFGKLVVMVIIVGMAFFGVDTIVNQIRGGLGANMAQAGARGFDPSDLDRRVETVLRNMNATAEKPMTKSQALENELIDQVFAQETARFTMLGYASSIGLKPSTDAVLAETKSIEGFQNPLTGELDGAVLAQRLQQLGFTLPEFEEQISDDLTIQAMQTAATSAVVSPKVLNNLQTLYLGESRNASWFLFDALKGAPEIDPTPEEVKAYYDSHLEELKQPERRSIDLLQMSPEDFLGEVVVTDQEIATIYEATKSERFSDPDQRTYAELVFDNREAAREAFGQLAGGADPNTVRGALSNVLRTARATEVAEPALRDAMFGAGRQSGAMFGPREFGGQWVVARLISVQPGAVKPLEEVSETIRSELAGERAQIVFAEKMERLDEVLAAGYDLSQISEDLKVPLMSFMPVDATGVAERGVRVGVLAEASDALAQAFRLSPGELTSRFDVADTIFVASAREVVPASTPAFETISKDVREYLIAERQSSAAQTAVDALIERIESSSESFEQAAARLNTPVESLPRPLTRMSASQSGQPGPIQQAIFGTQLGKVVSLPTNTPNRFVILTIKSIEPPSAEAIAALDSELSAIMSNALGQDLAQALQTEVAKEVKVRRNLAALEAYKRSIAESQ